MKLARRRFLHLTAGAAAVPAVSRIAAAESYPSRPVRVAVGFPPGGPIDISARIIAQWLSERLGQQFIVDNRPGASGNIADEAVVRSPADGHTLLMANGADAVNASLFEKLNFVFVRDIAAVAGVNRIPHVLEVHPSFEAKTVADLIATAKASPGKITIATPGIGTGPYMGAELLKMMAGIDMVNVPYRGAGPMLVDVLGGQIKVAFDGMSSSIGHIKAGELRPLAVTTTTRLEALPDVPTVAEFVPGYEEVSWCGLTAPAAIPAEIVNKLNAEVNAGLADPGIKAKFAELGVIKLGGTPAEFGKLIAEETEKWAKVVKFAGIKPQQ
jgi:tripartite-type tricarboxylate transporter receptor subunit TctC